MSTEQQSARAQQILSALRWARIESSAEARVCQSPDGRFRCDVAIMRKDGPGVGTVIVCADRRRFEDLAGGLGRAEICRQVLHAEHSIICLPPGEFPPEFFLEACGEQNVCVASDTRILHALAKMGLIDADLPLGYDFMSWVRKPPPAPGSSAMLAFVMQVAPALPLRAGANRSRS